MQAEVDNPSSTLCTRNGRKLEWLAVQVIPGYVQLDFDPVKYPEALLLEQLLTLRLWGLNDQIIPFAIAKFVVELRTGYVVSEAAAGQDVFNRPLHFDAVSYGEALVSAEQTRHIIQDYPYGIPLHVFLAQQYSYLAYPDLAAGASYKALLLVDAAQDEDDEYHEQALDTFNVLMSDLASEEERQIFHASHIEPCAEDDHREACSVIQSVLQSHYLPQIYQILVSSLEQCSCYRSAYTFASQAQKLFPESSLYSILAETKERIAIKVAQHFELPDTIALEQSPYSHASSWPDTGLIRREMYPWNNLEPDRLAELPHLNAMIARVAPKLEVRVVELPDLTSGLDAAGLAAVKQLGVFAKEDIPPAEIVLSERSMLTANNKLQDSLCDACSADLPDIRSAEASDLTVCSDCQVVFCSKTCMEEAMKSYHLALCDRDVEAIAKDLPATEAANSLYSLLLLRALAMAETQQCHPLELLEVKYIWGDFHNSRVESFSEARNALKTLPFNFESNVRLPFHMLEKMDIDLFANQQYDVWVFNTLYAKFRGTASARLSGLGGRARGPEVSAVHPMWCIANHSCDPNVSWEWGANIEFTTRKERVAWKGPHGERIEKSQAGIAKGEEVLNHYCDVDLPASERQKWARGALGGKCRCERCKWEAGEVT